MNKFVGSETSVKRTARSVRAPRMQAIDDLDIIVIDVVRESPDITMAEAYRRVVRRSTMAVKETNMRTFL